MRFRHSSHTSYSIRREKQFHEMRDIGKIIIWFKTERLKFLGFKARCRKGNWSTCVTRCLMNMCAKLRTVFLIIYDIYCGRISKSEISALFPIGKFVSLFSYFSWLVSLHGESYFSISEYLNTVFFMSYGFRR